MNQSILLSLVALVAALPPVVDEALKSRVASARMLGLYTMLIGVAFGVIGGALTQIAAGSTFGSAATVALSGFASGAIAGVTNWIQASNPGGAPPMAGARRGAASALTAVAALSLLVAGCGWFTPAKQADVATIAACVLAHEMDPPLAIAEECAVENLTTIEQILSAHKLAEHREAAADAGAE